MMIARNASTVARRTQTASKLSLAAAASAAATAGAALPASEACRFPLRCAARAFASKSGSPNAAASAAGAAQMKKPSSGAARRGAPSASATPLAKPVVISHQSRSASLPTFNALMKRFNLLVHPDLFMTSPAQAHQNQQSLQALNSLLAGLKTRDPSDPYPPKQVLQLVFYIKKKRGDEAWVEYIRKHDVTMHLAGKSAAGPATNTRKSGPGGRAAPTLPARGHTTLENEFHIIPTLLSTNGGQCKRSVQDQMASLFYRVGLPVRFRWDEEYWNMGGAKDQKFAEGEGQGEGGEETQAEQEEGEWEEGEEWGSGEEKQSSSSGSSSSGSKTSSSSSKAEESRRQDQEKQDKTKAKSKEFK